MDPLYWPQPGWVQFQLWYLEVPGLLVTTLQFCLVQCYKEIQYLLQNKMSTCDMCSVWSCFNSRESEFAVTRSRPNQIAGPGPKSGPARKSESRGPENGVSRWRRPNSDIYSQNHHFDLVYDMIYQFLGMEAKNYKFGMFCQQCHPSVASGDADIRPRNASRIHTCHLFTS